MRTSQLVTQYLQSLLFAALGLRAVTDWVRQRGRREAHLAVGAGLFGLGQLVSAISTTLYDPARAEIPPRAVTVLSSVLIFTAIYGFILFLSDFLHFPPWAHALAIGATAFAVVMGFIERADFRIDPQRGLVPIPGVSNPIDYRTWVGLVLAYLAVAFGLLWVAFGVYGLRVRGLASFRMLAVAAGFFVLFVAVGLLPRIVFGDPTASTVRTLSNVVRYMALVSAPLLYIGFTPPRWLTRLFGPEARSP